MKVRITASARLQYSQVVEITPEQYAEYEAICEFEPRAVGRLLADKFEHLLDLSDISDGGDIEDIDITPVALEGGE